RLGCGRGEGHWCVLAGELLVVLKHRRHVGHGDSVLSAEFCHEFAREDSAIARIACRVAVMLPRSPFSLAAMTCAARAGAFAVASRRKLKPGPWVNRCRTL